MDGYTLEVKGRICQPLIGIFMIKKKTKQHSSFWGKKKNLNKQRLASRVRVLDCATVM